jgi:hypothetical protein
MTLAIATVVDMLVLLTSLWLILQTSDLSVFNPSLWYIALHAYSVTFRLIMLNAGAQSALFIGVRSDAELVGAAIAADISLLAIVAATMLIAHRAYQAEGICSKGSDSASYRSSYIRPLSHDRDVCVGQVWGRCNRCSGKGR